MKKILESYWINHCMNPFCYFTTESERRWDLPDKCAYCGSPVRQSYTEMSSFTEEDYLKIFKKLDPEKLS